MKNISLLRQIVIINISIMAIFMSIFVLYNYYTVKDQMQSLENEKIKSIVKSIKPIIAINLSLELKSGYVESIDNTLKTQSEIVYIILKDLNKKTLYESKQEYFKKIEFENNKYKKYETNINDSISGGQIGNLVFYYRDSFHYISLLKNYQDFLFGMLVLFIISLFIIIFSIRKQIEPLQKLKNFMLNYTLKSSDKIKQIDGNNEIAVINNTTKEMLSKIELEVEKRLLYEKELMHKNRLASMGEMIDNIAHQWRQPLMNINSVFLNIDRAYELKKLDSNYLDEKINEGTNIVSHMSQTIEDFRYFLNPKKEKKDFYAASCIEKASKLLEGSLKNIDIQINSKGIYFVQGYENEFIQVIMSILNNSVDIFKQKDIEDKSIYIDIKEENTNVLISISDNAGGIKPELVDRVFEPYFTTKHKFGGTGLGLYMAKIIINSMDGEIGIKNNKKNNGVEVSITLPLAKKNKEE